MVLFMIAGIGVVFATIMIFYVFDNTIKSEEEIEKVIELIKSNDISIRAIHKKFVNKEIRRYCYEEITF